MPTRHCGARMIPRRKRTRLPGQEKELIHGIKLEKRTRITKVCWWAAARPRSSASALCCVIALGTLLLTLPIASRSGRLGVVDAMFTATSATCVTGLVVRDTWTQFTMFGQAVVLLLIQVGGLGLVTLTSFFALAAKRRAWASGICGCWARASRPAATHRPPRC